MRRKHACLFILLYTFITSRLLAQDLDTLIFRINRRIDTYEKNGDYRCRVTTREHTMDKNWKIKKTKLVEKKLKSEQDKAVFEVIRAMEYKKDREKDITEQVTKEYSKAREEAEKHKGDKHQITLGLDELNAFSAENRNQYLFALLADTVVDNTPIHRIRSEATEKSDERFEGIYWIHPETYAITHIDLQPSKNPKMVKKLHMKLWFKEFEGNRWMPVQTWTRVFVNLLIKKIRIESEGLYSDYVF